MLSVLFVLVAFILADLIWWRIIDTRLRRLERSTPWRILLAAFVAGQLTYAILFVFDVAPASGLMPWRVMVYLWHVLILPGTLLALGAIHFIPKLLRTPPAAAAGVPGSVDTPGRVSRRQAIGVAAAALLPPLITAGTSVYACEELGGFRIRRLELPVPGLPADLDGLTIAHLTDLHIGVFLPRGTAQRVAEATNALAVDLVAFTGDVLDTTSRKVQPAIEFIRRLDPRHGLAMIEGNHDIMHGVDRFEQTVKEAGLPLLLDESLTFRIPGRATPVQVLGIAWGDMCFGREIHHLGREANLRFRETSAEARANSVRRVLAQRDAGAFPILLAHHPHAFDPAAACGLPLVLAGHTHGGQLMLTRNIGAGPLRFRYWTGIYRKPNSKLFISNGIGNWFPLRINAPPEIVHLTLRQEDQTNHKSQDVS